MYAIRSYYGIISDYERNKHMPSGDKLNRIAKEFGVTADVITSYSIHYTKLYDEYALCEQQLYCHH